jgi:hypothetical protein
MSINAEKIVRMEPQGEAPWSPSLPATH